MKFRFRNRSFSTLASPARQPRLSRVILANAAKQRGDTSTSTCALAGAWLTTFPSRLFRIAAQSTGSVDVVLPSISVLIAKPRLFAAS